MVSKRSNCGYISLQWFAKIYFQHLTLTFYWFWKRKNEQAYLCFIEFLLDRLQKYLMLHIHSHLFETFRKLSAIIDSCNDRY